MEDENKLTLRDKIAMSMDAAIIPNLENKEAIKQFENELGLNWDDNNIFKQIEFILAYQAYVRYLYAEKMMEAR